MTLRVSLRRAWTSAEDELLIRQRDAGVRLKDIAKELGRTPAATMARASLLIERGTAAPMSPSERSRRAGMSTAATRADRWTPEEDAILLESWRSGATSKEAARILGRPPTAAGGRLHKLREAGQVARLTAHERNQRERRVRANRSNVDYANGVERLAALPNTRDLGYVIGVLNGDGFIHRSRLSACLKTTDRSFANGFARALKNTFGPIYKRLTRIEPRKTIGNYVYTDVRYYEVCLHQRHLVQAIISTFGPFGSRGWRINAEDCLARGSEFTDGVLQGFFDSEGSVETNGFTLRMSSVHEAGMRDLLRLLERRGFEATLSRPSKRGELRIRLRVGSAVRFAREIGSRIDRKMQRMRAALRDRR